MVSIVNFFLLDHGVSPSESLMYIRNLYLELAGLVGKLPSCD